MPVYGKDVYRKEDFLYVHQMILKEVWSVWKGAARTSLLHVNIKIDIP